MDKEPSIKVKSFIDRLREASARAGSIACLGMDPVMEKISVRGEEESAITEFFRDIIEAMEAEDEMPGIAKPNYAFFAQYGFPGLRALQSTINLCKAKGILTILDAKRGDIGKSSEAYAREAFSFWKADAVTVAPFMGSDSVGPFIEYCQKGYGVYILNRTSNKGATDIQNLDCEGEPVYMRTAERILEWHRPGTGVVAGATYPEELATLSELYAGSGKVVPFLIPGVGAQGGSAEDAVQALRKGTDDISIHRINSSSGILYAYLKEGSEDYAGCAVKELKRLNKSIGSIKL